MLDSLEPRRLMAATVKLVDGTLRVTGTDESNVIAVELSDRFGATTGNSTVHGYVYVVRVDNQEIGEFSPRRVRQISVFGLGGNDRITGPASLTGVTAFGIVNPQAIEDPAFPVAPIYADGGSGNDRIVGGTGNDTLIGGRGNDALIDEYGSNTFDGGRGDDVINAAEGKDRRFVDGYLRLFFTEQGAPDQITGGPGTDLVAANGDDVLLDTPEQHATIHAPPIVVTDNGAVLHKVHSPLDENIEL